MPAAQTKFTRVRVTQDLQVDGGTVFGDSAGGTLQVTEYFRRITVSSAELLALNGTPKTIVPAPGTGKLIEFLGGTVFFKSTATAYAAVATKNFVIRFTDGSGPIVSTSLALTGLLDQTTDQIRTIKQITTDLTPVANSPLVLQISTAEITTGTGVVYIDLKYHIHSTGL